MFPALRAFVRAVVPKPLRRLYWYGREKAKELTDPGSFVHDCWLVGPRTALALSRIRHARAGQPGAAVALRIRGVKSPVYVRPGTSDSDVVRQVFGYREYECVARMRDVQFIVDCGANVGLTSVFLLSRYPNARLVAIEPDPGNMAVCRRNLAPFADRAVCIEAGVWSVSAPMVVVRGTYRDGRDWAHTVRPCAEGEAPDFRAVTVPQVMAEHGLTRVDLLKVDIEGAEAEVFNAAAPEWLSGVRAIAVELHGDACERAFFGATAASGLARPQPGSDVGPGAGEIITVCRPQAERAS